MMDETVKIDFALSISSDGTIAGKGRADVSVAPGKPDGNICSYTWSVDPADFDVAFDGNRNGEELDIEFQRTPIELTVLSVCGDSTSTQKAPDSLWILTGPLSMLQVRAVAGTTALHAAPYDGTMEIHRPAQTADQ